MTIRASRSLLWSMLMAIVVLVLSVMILLTEATVRFLYPDKALMYESDPLVLARFQANLDREDYGSDRIRLRTNSFAFRDDEDFDPALADILVLGDSNIAALSLEFEDTLGERIEDELDDRFVAANLGVPGYGPDQSLRRYLEIADRSSARAIVFHLFADNDFGDLFRNGFYTITNGELVGSRNPHNDPVFSINRSVLLRGINRAMTEIDGSLSLLELLSRDGFYAPLHQGMEDPAFSTAEDALGAWVGVSREEYARYEQGGFTIWTADHYDYGIAADPEGEMAVAAGRLVRAILSRARFRFPGSDQCILVLIQPSENDISDVGSTIGRARLRSALPAYDPRRLTQIAVDAAGSAGVATIDLYDVFSRDPERYYFSQEEKPGDGHWNAEGVAKAAEIVATHLREHRCMLEDGVGP